MQNHCVIHSVLKKFANMSDQNLEEENGKLLFLYLKEDNFKHLFYFGKVNEK